MAKCLKKVCCVLLVLLLLALTVLCLRRYEADRQFDRGRRLLARKELEPCSIYLKKAVELNPGCCFYRTISTRVMLQIAVNSKRSDLVKQALEEAIILQRMYPEWHDSYYIAGQCYSLLGQKKKAIKYYKKAISLHPYNQGIRKDLKVIL